MLDLIFVSLLQAAAGAPGTPPEAPPAEAAAPTAEAQPQAQDPADQVRCRRTAHTGSRIASTRVCMSARQEEQLREQTRHELREARSRSITGTQENAAAGPR